jgi:DNA replication licensing factor MCM3
MESDALEAEIVLRFALFKEVLKRKKASQRKKRKLNAGGSAARDGEASDESDEESDEEEEAPARMSMPPQQAIAKKTRDIEGSQGSAWAEAGSAHAADMTADDARPPVAGPAEDGGIRPERYVLSFSCCARHIHDVFTGWLSSVVGLRLRSRASYKTQKRYR